MYNKKDITNEDYNMDYKALLKNRRSIRRFMDQPIDPKVLDEILNDTCMAPSASNMQPWRFIVIQDKEIMKKLSDESKKNRIEVIEKDPSNALKQYETILRDSTFNVFYNAPCLIIIAGKKSHYHFNQDCSLAAAYLMFAAIERNLGTCWIALGDAIEDIDLRREIGLSEDYQIVAPIIIGYPDKIPSMGPRNKPEVLKVI